MNSLSEIRADVARALGGSPGNCEIDYLAAVDSTNSELKRRRASGLLKRSTVLVTDSQTAGRGTHGRSWCQQPGQDLALTAAAAEVTPGFDDPRLPLAAGAAAALALEAALAAQGVPNVAVRLRWPNDLCLGEPPLKCGGLLLEKSRGWLFCGVGVNLNTRRADLDPQFSDRATTLREFAGRELDRRACGVAFVAGLLERLGLATGAGIAPQLENLLGEWQTRDASAGKSYILAASGELIRARGVDTLTGELMCTDATGSVIRIRSYADLRPQ